jgi:hypothetical protein
MQNNNSVFSILLIHKVGKMSESVCARVRGVATNNISCTLTPLKFSRVVGLEGWPLTRHEELSRCATIYGFIIDLDLFEIQNSVAYVHT